MKCFSRNVSYSATTVIGIKINDNTLFDQVSYRHLLGSQVL